MSVSEELLDVVDADDNIVGVEKRGEIHARGLMHRSVHILVFNSRGELFLQKRSMQKDEMAGLWDSSAAGHVDRGESYLDCAIRGIEEELGIVPEIDPEVLFKLPATPVTGYEHATVYRYVHDGALRLDPDEIDDGAWLAPADMDARVAAGDNSLTDAVALIWQRYRDLHRESGA